MVVAAALLTAWSGRACAEEPATPAPQPAATPRPVVGEVGPEIYYLQDDAGRLVPVPGFRYRDFLELFRLREGLPAALEPPAVVLESMVARCDLTRADPGAATCPATIEVTVRQTRAGWAQLPLGLDGLVLDGPPRHEGPGRVVVDADPDGGYRGWFDAPAGAGDARHQLVLTGALPVELSERRDTLALRLPAATAATVEVRTPRPTPDVTALPPPPARPSVARDADGATRVSIAGVSGPVRVRIAAAGAGDAGWEPLPQSSVESVVRTDGRSALVDATVRLENLRPGTDTIDVTLPPRFTLRAVRPPATLVARGGTADAPTATISIERARDGRAAAELECERPVDPAGGAAFESIGFAVAQIEAWRQWGRVSLVVDGDWRAEWADRPGVRRVDPPASARRPGFVAAFAYDALPASLPIRVRPRVSRVVVEPAYRYDVGAARVALSASLRVVARGAPATTVTLDVDPTFDIEEVGPPGVVDAAAVTVEGGRVSIPFVQPLSGDAVVEVRGIRWIDREATGLSWQVPVPRADVVAPARVVVAADSDIALLPDSAASGGLGRQAAGSLPRGEGEAALVYRMDGAAATFVATRRFLERRVDAAVDVRARLDEAEAVVEQSIGLDVAHVPLEYLELAVPAELLAVTSPEVRQGGVPLDPVMVGPLDDVDADDSAPGVAPESPRHLLRAVLWQPLLGTGEVTVRFRIPLPAVPPETTVAADLPLALPAGARIERVTVAIEPSERLAVAVRGSGWRSEAGADEAAQAWNAVRPQAVMPLALSARRRAAVEAVVEAAWLRTQVLPDRREDLTTYVLAGGGESVTLAVPATADTVSCTVSLDGAPQPAIRDAEGRFAVTLPRAAPGRRRIVEVRSVSSRADGWAALAARFGLPARLRLDPPAFGAGVAERRFYWEVLARPDEHVLGAPAAWTAQQRWLVGRTGLVRVPVVEPATLAAWIRGAAGTVGVPVDEPLLVVGRAVWSGFGAPGTAVLWLVPTWCAVLVASGIALAAGLALAYVAAARRPAVLIPLVAAVGVAAAALPDLAPLAAQAAVPGAVLSLLAWIMRGVLDRGVRGPTPAPLVAVSASSITRAVTAPSLVIAGSSMERGGSVTTGGRSSS
ncbi:MAG: hypothetical protein ACKOSQ_11770 [Planctomycetaceae bacterium]